MMICFVLLYFLNKSLRNFVLKPLIHSWRIFSKLLWSSEKNMALFMDDENIYLLTCPEIDL